MLLLVWLYVMANILVLGAEVNWWLRARTPRRGRDARGGLAPDSVACTRSSSAVEHLLLDVRLVVDQAAERLAREDEEAERA